MGPWQVRSAAVCRSAVVEPGTKARLTDVKRREEHHTVPVDALLDGQGRVEDLIHLQVSEGRVGRGDTSAGCAGWGSGYIRYCTGWAVGRVI